MNILVTKMRNMRHFSSYSPPSARASSGVSGVAVAAMTMVLLVVPEDDSGCCRVAATRTSRMPHNTTTIAIGAHSFLKKGCLCVCVKFENPRILPCRKFIFLAFHHHHLLLLLLRSTCNLCDNTCFLPICMAQAFTLCQALECCDTNMKFVREIVLPIRFPIGHV